MTLTVLGVFGWNHPKSTASLLTIWTTMHSFCSVSHSYFPLLVPLSLVNSCSLTASASTPAKALIGSRYSDL